MVAASERGDSRCHRSNASSADKCALVSVLTGILGGELTWPTERLPFMRPPLIYIGMARARSRVQGRDGTRERCQLHEGIGRDPLDATAVGAPRPERLAGSNPALHVRPLASVAGHRMREIGRSTARPRDRTTVRAEAPLLRGRFRRNLEGETAAAVETADVPDIVELLQRLDRVGLVTRRAARNSPGICSDSHVGL